MSRTEFTIRATLEEVDGLSRSLADLARPCLPAEKLVEAVRCGSIRVLSVEGVVGRVLTEAMQEAVNDPGPKRAAG